MKFQYNIVILIIFIMSPITGFSSSLDKIYAEEKSGLSHYIANNDISQNEKSDIPKFLKDTKEITSANSNEIHNAMYKDVFSYYELESRYNTPLKKKYFQNSVGYRQYANELKNKQQEIKKTRYYITYNAAGSNEDETLRYDINKKGLIIYTGTSNYNYNRAPFKTIIKEDLKLYFQNLPTIKIPAVVEKTFKEFLFIPIDEKNALDIENNISTIKIFIQFKITDIKYMKYEGYNYGGDWNWYLFGVKVLNTKDARIIMYDEKNKKIYFDKNI